MVIGETARVYSYHQRNTWRQGRRADAHALRIVYDGWVPLDSPEPHVVEVDGSTMEAAWQPVAGVLDGSVPVVSLVTEVLEEHRPFQLQRVAAYALVLRDAAAGREVLLTRNSSRGPHPGWWTLPGGGIDHGEEARHALVREVREETGLDCTPGEVLDVGSTHFEGTAPVGAPGGLPRPAGRLRRHRLRGRAGGAGGRRHHRRCGVGAGRRRSATSPTGSETWSGRRSPPASVG